MKPPICCICDKRLDPDEGGLIYFKKRPLYKTILHKEENGMVGHPPYAEWFCRDHYSKAKELEDLPIDKAMKVLEM